MELQLISSELGVYVIRLFQIPVYQEGNVIDLGLYKLQVVEACSGLRYLYPLLSLGFLAAYFFHAPMWQRAIVFLSTIPITIIMNSVRIGVVGVLTNYWGAQTADGALHFFEGWVIFMACALLLVGEILILARLGSSSRGLGELFSVPKTIATTSPPNPGVLQSKHPLIASLCLLMMGGIGVFHLSGRAEIIPERPRFVQFPRSLGPWQGRPVLLEPQVEGFLKLDDYVLSDYQIPNAGAVNLYVAYYSSQRKGASPHSPSVCIPGGGWLISKFERTDFADGGPATAFPVNRVVIERGATKQIVYYWFVQRGRKVANEYWSKWYLFADAIMMNRTDGALVRVTTPVYAGETEHQADGRAKTFIKDMEPRLGAYLSS